MTNHDSNENLKEACEALMVETQDAILNLRKVHDRLAHNVIFMDNVKKNNDEEFKRMYFLNVHGLFEAVDESDEKTTSLFTNFENVLERLYGLFNKK
jgi:hypothetical protein